MEKNGVLKQPTLIIEYPISILMMAKRCQISANGAQIGWTEILTFLKALQKALSVAIFWEGELLT